ncbi:hypothetical protein ACJX0J_024258, partial [Zea mays]
LPQQPEQVRGGPQQPDGGLDEADLGRRLRHRRLHRRLRPQPPSRPQGQRLGDGRPQDSLRDPDVVPPPQHRHLDRRSEEPRAAYRRAPNQVRNPTTRPRPAACGVKCSVLAGACNLCNGGIRFVRDKHPNRSIRDMPLQIESRRELLQRSGRSPDGISSVILVEKDRSFIKSKVVIRIMEYLNLFEIHGIIRKTRTVMECLHRFCRDCIDKSMRLGNNECPACRTHCASRRSLRDDPNYDALIAALYPDIDKYEEEEFAFSEQERIQNKKIQETIEETFRRQSDAIGKKRSMAKATATAFARKYRRTRGRVRTIPPDITPTGSSEEERGEGNSKETIREQSSTDDHSPDLRQKRCRKRSGPQGSPAGTIGSIDYSFEENDELRCLLGGENGARSQNRHGSVGSNGRTGRSGRIAKLVDYLHTADEMDKDHSYSFKKNQINGTQEPKSIHVLLMVLPSLTTGHYRHGPFEVQLGWCYTCVHEDEM